MRKWWSVPLVRSNVSENFELVALVRLVFDGVSSKVVSIVFDEHDCAI
jgi:hypothetical protein